MDKEHKSLMIAVCAPPQHGKSTSTSMLADSLYEKLVVQSEGWEAKFLNTRRKHPTLEPYNPATYKRPDKMLVFEHDGIKKIAVVTWGDELEGPVKKSFTEILRDIASYEIIVGCCHPKSDVWRFFNMKIKPHVTEFVAISTYQKVKPASDFQKWNELFAKQLEDIVLE